LLSFGGPVFLTYSSKVDAIITSAIAACYGESVTLTQPILLQSTINSLAGECHSLFPLQCTAISTLLNFEENFKLQKRLHLLPVYSRMVFYSFMLLARMRNNKNFAWWGVVNACIRYGSYDSSSRSTHSVFFGHSVSQRTMMEKTKELQEPRLVLQKSKKALSSSKVHIGVFDNMTDLSPNGEEEVESRTKKGMTTRISIFPLKKRTI
jgi:hypothetical protein